MRLRPTGELPTRGRLRDKVDQTTVALPMSREHREGEELPLPAEPLRTLLPMVSPTGYHRVMTTSSGEGECRNSTPISLICSWAIIPEYLR
jgi:hypothetical protein